MMSDASWVEVRSKEHDKPGLMPIFDELLADNVSIHIERMSDETYWMGITKGDERQVVVFSSASMRAKINARTERDG
jgi:hypothetical protein